MNVLVADDDIVPRCILQSALKEWGYDVTAVADGEQAFEVLADPSGPKLAVLDWVMPGMDGVEVCRRLRVSESSAPVYVILLTSRDAKADIVAGLAAGANDYVTKPFDRAELQARVRVGQRVVELQHNLAARIQELEEALAQVKRLQGLLPICAYCKKVRDDKNYWQQVEAYIGERAEVRFSHGICPECLEHQMDMLRAQSE
jgi:DNA-binding response OmpR family regulator